MARMCFGREALLEEVENEKSSGTQTNAFNRNAAMILFKHVTNIRIGISICTPINNQIVARLFVPRDHRGGDSTVRMIENFQKLGFKFKKLLNSNYINVQIYA